MLSDVGLVGFLWFPAGGTHDIRLTIGECAIVRRVPTCCRFPDSPSI